MVLPQGSIEVAIWFGVRPNHPAGMLWFDVKPATVTAFAKVKGSIRQTLLQQKKNEAMQSWGAKLKKDFDGKVSYQTGYAPPSTSTNATTTG